MIHCPLAWQARFWDTTNVSVDFTDLVDHRDFLKLMDLVDLIDLMNQEVKLSISFISGTQCRTKLYRIQNQGKSGELINSLHCAFRTIRSSWYEYSRTQDCLLADTIALYNSFPSTARITFFRETDVVSALQSKLFTWLENPQKFWPQIDASWAFRGIISRKLSYSLTQILSQAEKNNQWLVNFRWN